MPLWRRAAHWLRRVWWAPALSVVLVAQSSVGPLAPVAYADAGVLSAEDVFGAGLPSLAALGTACEAATGGMCTPALALGALLVAGGWVFANRNEVYSAIQTAWNGLTGSQAEELKANLQANGGSLVNPSADLEYSVNSSVANVQATGGWTAATLTGTNAYTGSYLTYSVPADSSISGLLTWTFSAPETASSGSWWLGDSSKNGGTGFFGVGDLSGSTINGVLPSGVTESWEIQDITTSASWTGTVGSGSTDNAWATGAAPSFGVNSGDQLVLTMSITNGTAAAMVLGLYAGSNVSVIPEFVGSGGIDHVGMPPITASGGTVAIQGYTVPGTFTPGVATPSTVNVPNTVDQLVNAGPGSTVTDVQGTQATIGSNASTGQVGLLGSILGGIEALPSDIAGTFAPTAAEEGVMEADWSSVQTAAAAAVPFAWWNGFFNTITGFFTPAGSACPGAQWSYTQSGITDNYNLQLCDSLGVLSTVRTFSSWVIYAMLLYFGYAELRRWLDNGGT